MILIEDLWQVCQEYVENCRLSKHKKYSNFIIFLDLSTNLNQPQFGRRYMERLFNLTVAKKQVQMRQHNRLGLYQRLVLCRIGLVSAR